MKRPLAALLALLLVSPAFGATEKPIPLPKQVQLVLPKKFGVAIKWLVPPVQGAADIGAFDMSPKGQPWLGLGGRSILNPMVSGMLVLDEPFQDFVWLDSGELLVSNGKSLGFLIGLQDKPDSRAVYAVFKPMIELPQKNARLFAGGPKTVYMVGLNPGTKKYELYRIAVKNKLADVLKVFEAPQPITSVAAKGDTVYAAVGQVVFALDLKAGTAAPVFGHPKEKIREVVYSPTAGFFYATDSGLGFFHEGQQFQFMKGKNIRIRMRKNDLYVLLEKSQGLFKLDGLDRFKELKKKSSAAKP